MRKIAGVLLMAAGTVLIMGALSLLFYNLRENKTAGEASQKVCEKMNRQLTEERSSAASVPENLYRPESQCRLRSVRIDGSDYVGQICIPALGVQLPVNNYCTKEGLKTAACRFYGDLFSGDLVIAGHNYDSFFGPLRWIDPGETVIFTDMDGEEYHYQVIRSEILEPDRITEMITPGEEDPWELTLFTCTGDRQSRVAVRCRRIS